jgi:hypothetical protein
VTPPSLDALFLRTYDGVAGARESHALGMPDEALR